MWYITQSLRSLAGLGLFLVRFTEPFVFNQIKTDLLWIVSCGKWKHKKRESKKDENEVDFTSGPLDEFLNSAMNKEYVFIILIAVNAFMDNLESGQAMTSVTLNQIKGITKIKFK